MTLGIFTFSAIFPRRVIIKKPTSLCTHPNRRGAVNSPALVLPTAVYTSKKIRIAMVFRSIYPDVQLFLHRLVVFDAHRLSCSDLVASVCKYLSCSTPTQATIPPRPSTARRHRRPNCLIFHLSDISITIGRYVCESCGAAPSVYCIC